MVSPRLYPPERPRARRPSPLCFGLLLLGFLIGSELFAAGPRRVVHTQRDSGVSIECQPYFSEIPARGYFPLRVTVSNHSGRTHSWELSTISQSWGYRAAGTRGRFRFTVPDGDSGVFDVLVPVGAATGHTNYGGNTTLQFSGYAVPADDGRIVLSTSFHSRGRPGGTGPVLGITASLRSENWELLVQDQHGDLAGASINPDRMPGDWRGFSGFDAIWIKDTEWRGLGGIERRALLDWTAAGGWLFVCYPEDDTGTPIRPPGLPAAGPEREPLGYGFGTVVYFPRDGNRLDRDAAGEIINNDLPSAFARFESTVHEHEWEPFAAIGLPAIPVFFFGAFLAVFAILVGPANFLFFAKPGYRHRLLWTTPAISLGAGLLLILTILLRDGTGGTGTRIAVWHHLPEENKAVVIQDQVSRTGLLVTSRFSTNEPSLITQVNIHTGRSSSGGNFGVLGHTYDGDWFLSRSTQAQWIQSVPATRSRIELRHTNAPAARRVAPEVVSTLEHELDIIFFRDANGRLWRGGPLAPGVPLTLVDSDEAAFESWWTMESRRAGPATREMIDSQKTKNGYFYASASGSASSVLDTLDPIEWSGQYSLHFGPLSSSP